MMLKFGWVLRFAAGVFALVGIAFTVAGFTHPAHDPFDSAAADSAWAYLGIALISYVLSFGACIVGRSDRDRDLPISDDDLDG